MKGTYTIDLSVKPHQLSMTIAQRRFSENTLVFKKTTPPQADSVAPATPETPKP